MFCCVDSFGDPQKAYNRQTSDGGVSSFPGQRRFQQTGGNALAAAPPPPSYGEGEFVSGESGWCVCQGPRIYSPVLLFLILRTNNGTTPFFLDSISSPRFHPYSYYSFRGATWSTHSSPEPTGSNCYCPGSSGDVTGTTIHGADSTTNRHTSTATYYYGDSSTVCPRIVTSRLFLPHTRDATEARTIRPATSWTYHCKCKSMDHYYSTCNDALGSNGSHHDRCCGCTRA